jgi:hypothetical protein
MDTSGEPRIHLGRSKISGTREWAVAEINCCLGCPHGCRYCYARYDQIERRRLTTAGQWRFCHILPAEVERLHPLHPLHPGQVMFPAAHDIVPGNLEACCSVLGNLLAAGNRVLVVSKPQSEYECSCQRYLAITQIMAEPDPLRIRYREALVKAVQTIVRGGMIPTAQNIWDLAEDPVLENDRQAFSKLVTEAIGSLHEGSVARYRLKLSEFQAWQLIWKRR